MVVLVEADPATASALQQAEREERGVAVPESVVGQRRCVADDVSATAGTDAHHPGHNLVLLHQHRDQRRLIGERQSAPDRDRTDAIGAVERLREGRDSAPQ
jgi:hypothetical protein